MRASRDDGVGRFVGRSVDARDDARGRDREKGNATTTALERRRRSSVRLAAWTRESERERETDQTFVRFARADRRLCVVCVFHSQDGEGARRRTQATSRDEDARGIDVDEHGRVGHTHARSSPRVQDHVRVRARHHMLQMYRFERHPRPNPGRARRARGAVFIRAAATRRTRPRASSSPFFVRASLECLFLFRARPSSRRRGSASRRVARRSRPRAASRRRR